MRRPRWCFLLSLRCAGIGASFYLGYSWLPSFFVTHAGLPTMLTLWMVLSAMVIFTFIVPIAGYLSDKGLRRVNTTIYICIVAALTSIPMFLAFRTKHLAACWLLQIFTLSLTAYTVCCSDVFLRRFSALSPLVSHPCCNDVFPTFVSAS